MRFWFVNHYALPPGASGGPTRHLGLSKALTARGHEVVVVASVFDHYTRRNHRDISGASAIEHIDGVTYIWLRTPPYVGNAGRIRNMATFAARAAALRAGVSAPDVVVGSSPHLLAGLAAHRLARRHGVPFVLEVRDIWPQSLIDLGEMTPDHPAMRALRALERWLYWRADHVVVVPSQAPAHVVASGGRPDAITVIPNGVEIGTESAPLESRPQGAPFTVVYAGTIGLANGLDVVADAAAVLKQRGVSGIRLRVVGAGPRRAALSAAVASRGVGDIMSVENAIPSSAVPKLLADADACLVVLASSPVFRWGISPTKLFDYMAAARPIISVVDAPDDAAVAVGAAIRVGARDAEGLASAIETLRSMPLEDRRAMGIAGRRYAEAHHSFDALAVQYEQLGARLTRATTDRVERWT